MIRWCFSYCIELLMSTNKKNHKYSYSSVVRKYINARCNQQIISVNIIEETCLVNRFYSLLSSFFKIRILRRFHSCSFIIGFFYYRSCIHLYPWIVGVESSKMRRLNYITLLGWKSTILRIVFIDRSVGLKYVNTIGYIQFTYRRQ